MLSDKAEACEAHGIMLYLLGLWDGDTFAFLREVHDGRNKKGSWR